MSDVAISFGGQRLVPLACGTLFWPARSTLLVADLHFEKGAALARRGRLVPPHDTLATLSMLSDALAATDARRLIALGDSFHDRSGPAAMPAEVRQRLTRLVRSVDWIWISGNHDGASAAGLGGTVAEEWVEDGLSFRHETSLRWAGPEISGHFHPTVRVPLRGGGTLRRRCFALGGERLVLPAYGVFTGGLDIADPALARALGCIPDGLLVVPGGVVRVPAVMRAPGAIHRRFIGM